MGRRHPAMEDFAAYSSYLNQATVWPSSDNEFVKISEMPARYATSALQKLIRWAGTIQARAGMNIEDSAERIRYIRNSPLGKALAAAALGTEMDLEADESPAKEPDINLVFQIGMVLTEAIPDLTTYTVVDVARRIARVVEADWTLKRKEQ